MAITPTLAFAISLLISSVISSPFVSDWIISIHIGTDTHSKLPFMRMYTEFVNRREMSIEKTKEKMKDKNFAEILKVFKRNTKDRATGSLSDQTSDTISLSLCFGV